MGQQEGAFHSAWPPAGAPLNMHGDEPCRSHFDNSVNAVSFGFVATAILISMFLVMAIFERFHRPNSPPSGRNRGDIESQIGFGGGKLGFQSPKMTVYSNGVSVLMPGNEVPTFIAHPAPVLCTPEQDSQPQNSSPDSSMTSSNSNSIREI